MNATVQKWGNSLALRIPSSVAKDVDLRPGSAVDLTVESGHIVVRPAKKRRVSLSQLLKGVTRANLHAETDWGAPVGKEIW
ncbi:MAG: AbrB/MazE/SpoVT family DNA-binding domain-containing protein [Elusimicrobia bacterium]|nr:AbrB/MazE/SpoVT family DNA-binding domain-containing protein [Elusimicrobiota bacterium]